MGSVEVVARSGSARTARVPERMVLFVAAFGAFLAFLDATIVNVAFPSLRAAFAGSSIGQLSWVLNAYNIVFASLLVVAGRLADLLGRRRIFMTGVLIFTAASVWCAASHSVAMLITARLAQAAGAALLVPASLALVVAAVAPERRAHSIGLWGAAAALASGLGPPIGGALVQSGGWRWAFLINLPFGLAALAAGRMFLVESRAPGRRRLPDLPGALISAVGLASLTLGLVKGGDWGWTNPLVLGSFVAAILMLVGFVISSRRHRSPLIDPRLLRIRSFTVGNVATIVAGAGFYAYLLTNILWLQYVWGYGVLRAGLALVPGALVAAVVAARLGPVAARHGYRRVIVPGAIVWSAAYLWYDLRVDIGAHFLTQWLPGQLISGIGVGATMPILGSAALAAVPGGRFATASAVNSSARQIGAVLGISLLVIIIGGAPGARGVVALRHGWVFSAACFALVAMVVATSLGRVKAATPELENDTRAADPVVGLPTLLPRVQASAAAAFAADPLLSRLPDATTDRLLSGAEPVLLPGGEWLFHAGDPAADMYVVLSGRLEVVVGGVVIRELRNGDVIGELALLTGESRSAGIRARRDSRLLRVGGTQFDSVLDADPALGRTLATTLAERLRESAPGAGGAAPRSEVVAVLGLDRSRALDEIATILAQGLRRHRRVAVPGRLDAAGLARAEAENDLVLLVADDSDRTWWDWCAGQADRTVLVADAATPPVEVRVPGPAPDLVLVGPAPARSAVRKWLETLRPWQLYSAEPVRLASVLDSLVDRMIGRSLGVVFGGGGARAFAHIGVVAELLAAGYKVDRVAGTSQGALVAALFATGADAAQVQEMCYREFVRRRPFNDFTLPTTALAKGRRAEQVFRRYVGDLWIEELPRQFRCSSTDLQSRAPYSHRNGPVVSAVMSSVALPVLFPPRRVDDRLLVDGGVLDNLPFRLLTERDEGPVVAVNIGMGGDDRPRHSDQPRPVRIPALGETLLRTMFIGSGGAVEAARAAGAVVVTPSSAGVGLLEFHQLDRMVESGRAAGRALLEQAGDLLGR